MSSKFFNSNGTLKGVDSLIVDYAQYRDKSSPPVYTIGREDWVEENVTYPSLYKLYMACEDLTEWEFADKNLSGWEHWELLQNNQKFQKVLDGWRKDLEQKLKSRAFREIQLVASEGGKNSFEANKLLLTGKWKEAVERQVPTRGRPSKKEVDSKLQEEYEATKSIREDLKRLGIDLQ